jgi:hypothetical protein
VGAEFLEGGAGEGTRAKESQEVVKDFRIGPPGMLGRDGVEHQGLQAPRASYGASAELSPPSGPAAGRG